MKKQTMTALALMMASGASAQTFSLDDNPSAPMTSAFYPGLFSAEDPFGLFLPAVPAGRIGPSPSLITVSGITYVDGSLLTVVAAFPAEPVLDIAAPAGTYLNAISQDHEIFHAEVSQGMNIRFSVDRATTGLPGTPLMTEFGFNQQPGDIYITERLFVNPGVFVGTLPPGPFGGVLPTAVAGPGMHFLEYDESKLNLTAGLGAGAFIPDGMPAPIIVPGRHDNVDAYNVLPDPVMDLDGDGIDDHDSFMSMNPGDASAFGLSAADIIGMPKGVGGVVLPPYAPSFMSGLDLLGFPPNTSLEGQKDDIDGLVVWDFGELSPNGDDRAEPGRDYAIFSLSETSASLAALRAAGFPVDGSTVFFTDFTGTFAIYLYGSQLGVADISFGDQQHSNVDALEICAEVVQPCDPCVIVDVNHDGAVTPADFTAWINAFNNGDPECDQNCDGACTPADFTAWIANYNLCTP
jgi:hypothetical protein